MITDAWAQLWTDHYSCSLYRRPQQYLGDKPLGVVVLVGAEGHLVGTDEICRHGLGGIPLTSPHSSGDATVGDQGMEVVHENMPPVTPLGRLGVGLVAQQSVQIAARAVGLVAKLDAAEMPCLFLSRLWSTDTHARP